MWTAGCTPWGHEGDRLHADGRPGERRGKNGRCAVCVHVYGAPPPFRA